MVSHSTFLRFVGGVQLFHCFRLGGGRSYIVMRGFEQISHVASLDASETAKCCSRQPQGAGEDRYQQPAVPIEPVDRINKEFFSAVEGLGIFLAWMIIADIFSRRIIHKFEKEQRANYERRAYNDKENTKGSPPH
jgi:hypothetical protein